jgi:hypothetical protein
MMRVSQLKRRIVLALASVLLLARGADAQSAIAGVVRDASGAVIPGVTVEASSAALIEKVRAVSTDAEGLYKIIDLRPGNYTVTFTLPGFTTVQREGIVLESNFTANVNAELTVGSVNESVTVSGASPVVDVQNVVQRQVMGRELLEALPAGRNYATNTVPAITRAVDVGGSGSMLTPPLNVYGSAEAAYNEVKVDGMSTIAAGDYPGIYINYDSNEEVVYKVGGGDAESNMGGVIVNLIPRQGGNDFSGNVLGIYADQNFQDSNYSDDLKARGLRSPSALYRLYDFNASIGGPIKREKLWFFTSYRNWATNSYIANAFNPDGSAAVDDYLLYDLTSRVTYQLDGRNKLSAYYDLSHKNQGHRGFAAGFSPAAAYVSRTPTPPTGNTVLKWTSAVSNKLLVEVGYSQQVFKLFGTYQPEVDLPSASNPFGTIAKRDLILGTSYDAFAGGETYNHSFISYADAAVSYVTGSHSLKVGEQLAHGFAAAGTQNQNGYLVQQYRSGVPDSVVVYNTPTNAQTNLSLALSLYAQDSWKLGRWTFNPGVRFDHQRNSFPEQTAAAGRFVAARSFAAVPGVVNWNDVSPRLGTVFDLFGDGKTAIKASVGKYPIFDHTTTAAQFNPMTAIGGTGSSVTETRTWSDLNQDNIAQDGEIGPQVNKNFGLTQSRIPDPDLKRPYSWMTNIGVQQQLFAGVGLTASYIRRDYRRLLFVENLLVPLTDYTPVTISDPRGNGEALTVYNLNLARQGLLSEYATNSDQNRRKYEGVDLAVTARFLKGGTITFASSTGRVRTVTCQVGDPNALRFCDQTAFHMPFLTSLRAFGTYALPYGIRLSGVFQSTPGGTSGVPDLPTTYIVNRSIVPNLTQASVNVRLDTPGTQLYDQINQLDFGVSKVLRTGRFSFEPKLEVANLLNVNTVLTQVTSYGSALGTPQTILPPRVVRLFVQVKF